MTGVDNLIAALTLAKKGMNKYNLAYPTSCEHDEMYLFTDIGVFTEEEIAQMEKWGFRLNTPDDGFVSTWFGSA